MIETVAQKLAHFLPQYGTILWAVLRRPVVYIRSHAARLTEPGPAVTFWAASMGIYILTRFLMFERLPNPFAYVAATGVSSGVFLILSALGFSWAARLLQRPVPVPVTLSAMAYTVGALIPVQSFLVILIFGAMRILNPALFVIVGNILNGCRDFAALGNILAEVDAGLAQPGSLGVWALGLYALFFLALSGIWLVYALACARALRRLAEASVPRFAVICMLGFVLMLVAGAASSGVSLMLLADKEACLAPPPASG